MNPKGQNKQRQVRAYTGKVVSAKMEKSVVVAIDRQWHHRIYKKAMRRTKKVTAHVENIALVPGDVVKIVETKPMSRTKHFRVVAKITT